MARVDLFILLLSILGVATLQGLHLFFEPPVVPISDAPAHEGARVAVEARVLSAHSGSRGRAIWLAQDGARILALAGPGDGPSPGDIVRVVGVVTRLDDGPGLSIESITLVLPAATRALEPDEIARSPESFEGARVLLRGFVKDGALTGGGSRITLAGEPPPYATDDAWLAAGTIQYRSSWARFVIVVDTWTPSS